MANALAGLAGKNFDELKIAFVPTAAFVDGGNKDWMINDLYRLHHRGAWVDVVDIAQLSRDEIRERFEPVDVVFVGGGNTYYLAYQMERSGMYDMLRELLKTKVYAGISAGSMVMGSTIRTSSQAMGSEKFYDPEYDDFGPEGRSSAKTYGAVDFAIRPHLNSRYFPEVTGEKIREVGKMLQTAIYAIDDQSAVQVIDGKVKVVGEGNWKHIKHDIL